jgi:hypothetical protein
MRLKKLPRKLTTAVGHELRKLGSRRLDISSVQTVCLALGPYRNLTTLTGAVISMHPECQVLNHGGRRVFPDRSLNFIAEPRTSTLENFIRFAISASRGGRRGQFGGSITKAHAFGPDYEIGQLYRKRFKSLVKSNPKALFWKESNRTGIQIRKHDLDLEFLFSLKPDVRFLMPIRNPMFCALSHKKTHHWKFLDGIDEDSTPAQLLEKILDELKWVMSLADRFPERFFYFYEHDEREALLRSLADFLGISHDPIWLTDGQKAMVINIKDAAPSDLVDAFRRLVEEKFGDRPDDLRKMKLFLSQPEAG